MTPITARRRRPFGGALLALALAIAAPAAARPLTLDDILHMESFGGAETDPTGRWLVFERRIGAAESFRFDYDGQDEVVRTRLWRVDLRRPGPARPLFQAARRAGYALGPFSPDGRRIAVFRLTDSNWELGVATPATGRVRWLGVTPELEPDAQTVAWTSPNRLLVIARPFGDLPFRIRNTRVAQLELPGRRRASAAGARSVTVVGSGRYLTLRPHEPPRRLLRLDLGAGRRSVLATGAFVDLAPSPDGRRIALLETGGDVTMDARRPIQGDYGHESSHRRLALLDLRTGAVSRPCPDCDVLRHPFRWSPEGAELLVFARRNDEPWTQGRLLRVAAANAGLTPVGFEIAPAFGYRPDAVRAAWFAGAPIVWGRPRSAPEAAARWYRLAPAGPVALGPDLQAESPDALTISDHGLLLAADGDVWRIAPDGRAARAAAGIEPLRSAQVTHALTFDTDPPVGDQLLGRRSDHAGDTLVRVTAGGAQSLGRLPAGGDILATPGAAGALVRTAPAGAEQRLTWISAGRPPTPVATINTVLADVTGPEVWPVRHRGPHGEALTSWLILPSPGAGPPPPLIVRPYLGSTVHGGPDSADPRHKWMDATAVLLAAHGDAVLLPSLPKTRDGAGVTAGLADRVLAIVATAAADPELGRRFDPNRLGLWGTSFGGYSTLAIVTQTDRFRAAIAEASMSDLFSLWGAFSLADRIDPRHGLSPFYQAGWVEDVQPSTGAPPWVDPQRYLFDSPALHADRVTTPVMMIHGELDNFPTSQPEEMFSGLLRQNKDAVLAIYWGENHGISSPGNLRDLYARAFQWLDDHLRAPITAANARSADDRAPAPASGARTPPPPPPRE